MGLVDGSWWCLNEFAGYVIFFFAGFIFVRNWERSRLELCSLQSVGPQAQAVPVGV